MLQSMFTFRGVSPAFKAYFKFTTLLAEDIVSFPISSLHLVDLGTFIDSRESSQSCGFMIFSTTSYGFEN